MRKVIAFVGSSRKKNTYNAAVQFLNNLQALGEVEYEIVVLGHYKLGICKGCFQCFEKGEEFCPLKDDRDVLMDKIAASDGVVFATPNYSFFVPGIVKVFLDRFGFVCHRPSYFGKAMTCIVTQGFRRGEEIVKYFDDLGSLLGFNMVKGCCLTALYPTTEKDQQKIDQAMLELSKRFYAKLTQPAYPVPSFYKLMAFRVSRSHIKKMLDDSSRDYRYYAEKGWLESDYFYPTHLGLLKSAVGKLFDWMTPMILKMIA